MIAPIAIDKSYKDSWKMLKILLEANIFHK